MAASGVRPILRRLLLIVMLASYGIEPAGISKRGDMPSTITFQCPDPACRGIVRRPSSRRRAPQCSGLPARRHPESEMGYVEPREAASMSPTPDLIVR